LDLVRNKERLWWLMRAASDFDRRIAPCSGERMQPVERCLMKLQNRARPQFERSITVFHVATDNIECEVELADTVFGLASSNFVGIVEKRCRLGNAMPILCQV